MAFTKVSLTILAGIVVTTYIAQSTSSTSQKCPYFEERNGKAIVKNQSLVYVCSIKSSSSVPTIIWNGSSFADCPGERIIQIGPGPSVENCGPLSANASTTGDCYTSVLSFTASPELNGTVVQCTDNDERRKVGSATIIIDEDPIKLKACPIYNKIGELHKIECSWSDFLKERIEQCYIITYTSDFNSHVARNETVCTEECYTDSCYDTYTHTVDPNTEECIVNVETLGPDAFIDTESVSTANQFLSIHVDNDCGGPVPCIARCNFLIRIKDEVHCRVDFTSPDGATHTSVATERGSAGDIVTFELTQSNGLPLLPSTVYSYQATTVDVDGNTSCNRVNSAFETGYYDYGDCTLADLGNSQENVDLYTATVCVEGETPLSINGGTVCYTGTIPGSTAVYHCGEGYGLSSESGVLVCQYNGVWNGTSPTCQTCSVSDLGDPVVDGNPSVCVEGEVPLFINGGTVCYNGTTPGSTAVYHCGEGYEASSDSTVLCQHDGVWNSPVACMRQDDLESISMYIIIFAGIVGLLLLVILILIAIGIAICIWILKTRSAYKPNNDGVLMDPLRTPNLSETTPDPKTLGQQLSEVTPDPETHGHQLSVETPDPKTLGQQLSETTPDPKTLGQQSVETPDPETHSHQLSKGTPGTPKSNKGTPGTPTLKMKEDTPGTIRRRKEGTPGTPRKHHQGMPERAESGKSSSKLLNS